MLWVLAALQIWIADESEKVRPDARPAAVSQAPRIRLAAAGGECVGAQVIVRGPALALRAAARRRSISTGSGPYSSSIPPAPTAQSVSGRTP